MPYATFSVAVGSPGNAMTLANGVTAPAQPGPGDDQQGGHIRVSSAMLAKLPTNEDGNLAVQFVGWAFFVGGNVEYFRVAMTGPFLTPFLDHAIGTDDGVWVSAIRHFTPDAVATAFDFMGSYQENTGEVENPGFYQLTTHFYGADENGLLPEETDFTPEPLPA